LLATAQVIDHDQVPTDEVSFGSVVLLATNDGCTYRYTIVRYTIVGSYEANPGAGRISYESPVGKALLGLKTSDRVVVAAPRD
jgi:transcription elongation factor GreA